MLVRFFEARSYNFHQTKHVRDKNMHTVYLSDEDKTINGDEIREAIRNLKRGTSLKICY